MKKYAILTTIIILTYYSQAQGLYMPRGVKQAYEKGSRSFDGKPGSKYWQNHGTYIINIKAAPPDRTITGSEEITYTNNSPDALRTLVLSLILNIHRPEAIRFGNNDADFNTPGIQIDQIKVNGKKIDWQETPGLLTWQPLRLASPLASKDSIHLSIDWHYQISLESSREGMIDASTYYLAYFYPRVAVYDDYNGWDRMPFTQIQEFYNDFNDYVMNVQVPPNYIVWGTGDLLNPSSVLQPEYARKLETSMRGDEIIHIATKADMDGKKVTKQNGMNTWQFKASHITDMTCAISDHFVWDASSVVVDRSTGRRASVQAAFNDTAKDFHHMTGFGRHALSWFSENWPGVPYPFSKSTIVQGYADMEYPMMVNDATQADTLFARFVAEHEIAHTYFPFYMGINETRYGFMDEGWATTFELLIGREDIGVAQADAFYKQFRVTNWIHDPSPDEDLPIITPGDIQTGGGLGNNEYGKPSLGYLAVKEILGDQQFKKCLHAFMDRWHGKHPIPWDFFYTFNDASGQDLNWFWNNWFFSNYYIDLALQHVQVTGNSCKLDIKNIGGMAAPFDVVVKYADGSTKRMHQSPAIWKQRQDQVNIDIQVSGKVSSISLDGGIFMDANELDNSWKAQ